MTGLLRKGFYWSYDTADFLALFARLRVKRWGGWSVFGTVGDSSVAVDNRAVTIDDYSPEDDSSSNICTLQSSGT
ncbi:hypothetical protein PG999_009942 [Apiospora kogelbergensis]|uniref:Uncharacterized protein n=1 Tax=Apiospora kogelbergensis TaxID=1337665 RepID=A0AAW0QTW5_9PEZI